MRRLTWWYRIPLLLLPSHLRAEHQRELLQLIDDSQPATGSIAALGEWLGFFTDVVKAAPRAHWDVLRQDLVLAVRQVHRAPGPFLAATAVLALGIGGNALVFSMVDTVLMRPLPYRESNRLVELIEENPGRGWFRFGISPANLHDLAEVPVFSAVSGYTIRSGTLLLDDRPSRVRLGSVDGQFFQVFTDRPALGRPLTPEDDVPGANAAVASQQFWTNELGGDPGAVGREVVVNGTSYRIVGVMPAGFEFPDPSVGLWIPLGMSAAESALRGARSLVAVGRLRTDLTAEGADAAVRTRAAALAETFSGSNTGWTASVRDLKSAIVGDSRATLLLLLTASGLVLLIAIANVVNLLLGRSLMRRGEVALRGALGARSSRLARQIITESAVLAVTASVLGLLSAQAIAGPVWKLAGGSVPRLDDTGLSPRVLVFTVALAILTTAAISLAPLFSFRRLSLNAVLGHSRQVGGTRQRRWQAVLVAGETALAVIVLIGGGLVARTLGKLLDRSLGVDAAGVVTFRIEPAWQVDLSGPMDHIVEQIAADRLRVGRQFATLEAGLRSLPGVTAAGSINRLPLTGTWWMTSVDIASRPAPSPEQRQPALVRPVTPGYLEAVGTRIIRGRALAATDRAGSEPVVVVDEALARAGWGDSDPLGDGLAINHNPGHPPIVARIVGIAESARMSSLEGEPQPTFYLPFEQAVEGFSGNWGMDVVIKTDGRRLPPSSIENAARAVFPTAAVFRIESLDNLVSRSIQGRRLQFFLLGSFGAVALALVVAGVIAVLSLMISGQTREIGLRMALGATPASVVWKVMRQALAWGGGGAAIGVMVSLLSARLLRNLVYDVSVHDPAVMIVGPILVLVAAGAAALGPGVRAARIDPVKAISQP